MQNKITPTEGENSDLREGESSLDGAACSPSFITYLAPDYKAKPPVDNTREVLDFIGPQPKCSVCGDTGEYETEYGPKGCNPCNSRLIAFVAHDGKTAYADWGDTIERRADGLHLLLENVEHIRR